MDTYQIQKTSVTKTGLPEGTTVTWKTRPDVSTPGSHPGVALVHYPDGTVDEVRRFLSQLRNKVTPLTQRQKNRTKRFVTTKYQIQRKVLITYPDKSTEEVTVTVEVTPQKR